ncbi:MAG: TetR/AcrR family transcriptional regulator, partial [Rhizobiales bacterium]|nr:TetR/AcrR family transcriptional regulator [Hyphomicrobiales bacterium]
MAEMTVEGVPSEAPTDCGRKGRRPAAGSDPAKRRQILDGARRIFIEMGFDAASMNDITRAAGVSKGTIYVYFASKEELFEALVDEEREVIFAGLYRALDTTEDLRESLVRFCLGLSQKITSGYVIR